MQEINQYQQIINKITNKFAIPSVFITEFFAENLGNIESAETKQKIVTMSSVAVLHLKKCAEMISAQCAGNTDSEEIYRMMLSDRVICRFILNNDVQNLDATLKALATDRKPTLEECLITINPNFDIVAYMDSHEPWN